MRALPLALVLLCPFPALPQSGQDPGEGKAIYRSNCAFCHGLTGRGGRGPSLVAGRFTHGSTDEDLKAVIRNGVPGTTMPAFETFAPDELQELVLFIRTLAGSGAQGEAITGDPAKGRLVYDRNGCAACHRIGDQGSVFGPDLSRIGTSRPVEYLRESLMEPSADIPPEYEGVTVVMPDGARITGVRVNEDTFSVQLRDSAQRYRLFQKAEVREVRHEPKSLMPAYRALAAQDLNNLLAYLQTLRGEITSGAEVKKAEGIR